MSRQRVTECWCCGRDPKDVVPGHAARGMCGNCYGRWRRKGFQGPGPGPSQRPPIADSACEYAPIITSLSARRAAERLGVTSRTVTRWRAALRRAS